MKKFLQDCTAIKNLILICGLLLITGSAWADPSTTYYAVLKAKLSSSSNGMGTVYAGTSTTAGTYSTESTSGTQSSTTQNETKQFYAFAKEKDGYSFTGWSTENGGSIVSTENPYKVSVKCSSSTESSPTTTTVFANFAENQAISVNFVPGTNGSYTVNGTKVTTSPSQAITCEGATALVATAASGYKFFGWYTSTDGGNTRSYISYSANASYTFQSATTVYADFIPSSTAVFIRDKNESVHYKTLTDALAGFSSGLICVYESGTVAAGNYTIPSGVTLLVPFDAAYTLYTTAPTWPNAAPSGQSAFRKLTLSSGANIVVNGAISVSAQSQGNQPYGGCVYGKYGQIDMQSGSTITLKSGANLYCWGYITGSGTITAKSGASVYEDFQLTCWRGGTAASTMNDGAQTYGVFPLAQYYIQNIEAPLTLEAGSHEYTCTAVTALRMVWDATVEIVGTNSGLFRISSGNVTKWYDSANDKQMYSINGVTALGAVVVNVSVTISSANFVLPLTNNMDITVASGTLTCDQRVAMLPGSRITINEGAKVQLSNNGKIYVYDKDEWKGEYNGSMVSYNYSGNVTHTPAPYSPSCSSIKTLRTFANMNDAEIDINGTFEASGALYTTKGGANIKSSQGTGTIIYKSKAGTETKTYQAFQGGSGGTQVTWHEIPVTSAQLHNSDAFKTTYGTDFEYLATAGSAAGTTITYANGHWGWMEIWKDEDGTVLKALNTSTQKSGAAPSNPTKECYTFAGWSTETSTANQEVIHTATYTSTTYAITYSAGANGSGTVTGDTKTCGVNFTLSFEKFTRTGYTQTGWSTTDGGEKAYDMGDTYSTEAAQTFYPFWTANTHKFAWDFAGGSTSSSSHTEANNALEYGTTITYPANNTMSKDGYTFTGWSTSVTSMPDNDLTIVAQWQLNNYTITYNKGAYGTGSIADGTKTPGVNFTLSSEKFTRTGYTQTGWSTEDGGDKVYDLGGTYTTDADITLYPYWTVNTYNITYKDQNNADFSGVHGVGYPTTHTYGAATALVNPSKDGYRFEGWFAAPECTGSALTSLGATTYTADITLYAKWIRIYTITWKVNGQDDVETNEAYGDKPVYPNGTPEKAQTNQNTFTFEGWSDGKTTYGKDETLPSVTGPATYTAQFKDHIRYYTITWKDWDGTELKKDEGEAGNMQWGAQPSYNGIPTRDGDGVRSYSFKGWYPEITAETKVSGDQEYTAQYNMDIKAKTAEPVAVTSDETARITTVAKSGKLNVSEGKKLTTTTLILEASENASGQITGEGAITTANAYFHLSHKGGFKARTWYAVAVPWQVAVPAYDKDQNGVYVKEAGGDDTFVQQELGRSYDLIYYDGSLRADEGHSDACWKYVEDDKADEHVMFPGRAYMIYFLKDIETIRFERKNGADLKTTTLSVVEHDTSNKKNAGWNGIANPSTYHAYINPNALDNTYGVNYGQLYDGDRWTYTPINLDGQALVVGQPVYVQVAKSNPTVVASADHDGAFNAPRRAKANAVPLIQCEVGIAPSEGETTDRVIVRTLEDKEDAYVIAQDLMKMGVSTIVPQMWVNRYDDRLCINTVAPTGMKADYPLGISVPYDGSYEIDVLENADANASLYLTYNGRAIWNLGYGPYEVYMQHGTNMQYGLRVVYEAPQLVTGMEEATIENGEQIRKVMIDDKVYIIRNGEMYSITGAKVQ